MKKLLLIAAMAAVALGASAGYNLEKVWELSAPSLFTVTNDVRQGFGMNGKFYIHNKADQLVYEVDQNGLTGVTFEGASNTAICRDEAGNIIVSNAGFGSTAWGAATFKVINPSDGSVKVHTIPPGAGLSGRCDFFGFCKGNMLENGELYLTAGTPDNSIYTDGIVRVPVVEGEVNEDDCFLASCTGLTATNTSTVINYYKDLAGKDALIFAYRSGAPGKITDDPESEGNFIRYGITLPNKGACNGVFPIIWDSKELYLYPTLPNYQDGFAIAEDKAGAPLIEVPSSVTSNPNGIQCNWLNAEVDANGVTIYQYVPGGQISVYRLTKTTDYTVAGTENLFGSNWDPSDTNNDMVMGEDGIYTWAKDNVEMTAGTEIKFKVVQDHDWANAWPSQDYYYKFAEDGTYNLKITFDPETEQVKFFVNGEDPNAEMVYTVVGPENVFGTNWNTYDPNNEMVKGEDGIYRWSKTGVTLLGDVEYKIVGNHSYAIYEYPSQVNCHEALTDGEGIYTVEITFNPEAEGDLTTCTLTKTGSITPVEHTYTVAGTENLFGSNWDPTDTTNDMVKGEDGIYTWTKNGVVFDDVTSIAFKIVQDHAWTYSWPEHNYDYTVQEGAYNFVITFNADTKEITCVATPAGLRGDVNNDQKVDITDATTLINYLLYGDATGINMTNANCDWQNDVDISDATTLINFLLYGTW